MLLNNMRIMRKVSRHSHYLSQNSHYVYHDDFLTPGNNPSLANSLKQIRHKSKSLKYPRLRPQRKQRLTTRDLNLGFLFALAITDFLAMLFLKRNAH